MSEPAEAAPAPPPHCSHCPRPIWTLSGALPPPRILWKVEGASFLFSFPSKDHRMVWTGGHLKAQPVPSSLPGPGMAAADQAAQGPHNHLAPLSPGTPHRQHLPQGGEPSLNGSALGWQSSECSARRYRWTKVRAELGTKHPGAGRSCRHCCGEEMPCLGCPATSEMGFSRLGCAPAPATTGGIGFFMGFEEAHIKILH